MHNSNTRIISLLSSTLLIFLSFVTLIYIPQGSAKSSVQSIKDAQQWILVAEQELEKKNYTDAIYAYEQAQRYYSSIKHLMLIAHAHSFIPSHCHQAIQLWEEIFQKTSVQKYKKILRKKIERARPKCLYTLKVTSQPKGANIWVDEELVGFTPMTITSHKPMKNIKVTLKDKTLVQEVKQKKDIHFTFKTLADDPSASKPAPMTLYASMQCRTLMSPQGVSPRQYKDLNYCRNRVLWEDDQFELNFSVKQDTYIYVLLANEKGQAQMLFPGPTADNLLVANQQARLPTTKGKWFTLDEVGPVQEKITILYSRNPIGELEKKRGFNQLPILMQNIQKFAMRGVKQDYGSSSFKQADSATDKKAIPLVFTGLNHINRIQFTLNHGGVRPHKK